MLSFGSKTGVLAMPWSYIPRSDSHLYENVARILFTYIFIGLFGHTHIADNYYDLYSSFMLYAV